MKTTIDCLLCQALVAPNHYERDECLQLISDMAEALREMDMMDRVQRRTVEILHEKLFDEYHG